MRKVYDSQYDLWKVQIADIEFDPKDRDDIPAVLMGLQALYVDAETRAKIFEILERHVRPEVSHRHGRPGMDLWRIFVLAVVKMALNCDFDRLTNLANHHQPLRQMLGHAEFYDRTKYHLQTVIDNVSLLTEEALQKINKVVVECGHARLNVEAEAPLECRVDSAVTKTNVHWPTDVNLLRDAMDSLLRTLHRTCAAHEVKGWRKCEYWIREVRKAFNRVRDSRRWRSARKVKAYLGLCIQLVVRATVTLEALRKREIATDKIAHYLAHALRQIDQIERRLIKNETIPHHEKVFSVHEPHTRWINKGKAGVLVELGLPICFMEDQYQFILHHEVLREGVDSDMIVQFIQAAQALYPSIVSCSMDKGYHSPGNRVALDGLLELNVLPKKGRKSQAEQARESAPAFAAARRKHPGIESAINNLNHRGLDRIRTHGEEGFVRTVALGVVAANVHRLGQIVKKQRRQYDRWHKARRKAA